MSDELEPEAEIPKQEHVVSPLAQPAKNVKIQSQEHITLLRSIPNATMYGPDVNLV